MQREVAAFVADNHASLLRRVLSWQEAVYSADEYPVWLREGLVNVLHLIPKTAYWAVRSGAYREMVPRAGWFVWHE